MLRCLQRPSFELRGAGSKAVPTPESFGPLGVRVGVALPVDINKPESML
jgi:hypothetical protein